MLDSHKVFITVLCVGYLYNANLTEATDSADVTNSAGSADLTDPTDSMDSTDINLQKIMDLQKVLQFRLLCPGQETFLAPSTDKQTCNYDRECSNHHPS